MCVLVCIRVRFVHACVRVDLGSDRSVCVMSREERGEDSVHYSAHGVIPLFTLILSYPAAYSTYSTRLTKKKD